MQLHYGLFFVIDPPHIGHLTPSAAYSQCTSDCAQLVGILLPRFLRWICRVSPDLYKTVQTGSNAFERIHQMPIWSWLKLHPSEGEVFTRAMMNLTQIDALILTHAYPFHEIQKLCAIAGGRGTLLAEILTTHLHLKAIFYDENYRLVQTNVRNFPANAMEYRDMSRVYIEPKVEKADAKK